MIDTSIVRVHQHGARITKNQRQLMGRSRGGLTRFPNALRVNHHLAEVPHWSRSFAATWTATVSQ